MNSIVLTGSVNDVNVTKALDRQRWSLHFMLHYESCSIHCVLDVEDPIAMSTFAVCLLNDRERPVRVSGILSGDLIEVLDLIIEPDC
uniref:Uncharacterized protein n=1 Tax=viral metagenome TaxID=1070528 RepID=A0A6M3L6W4_9ZZZZ